MLFFFLCLVDPAAYNNIALGPCAISMTAALVPGPNTLPDYMKMSMLSAFAVGQGMMQFTQSVAPQAAVSAPLPGHKKTFILGMGLTMTRLQS